ncbi:MAG TPA: TIR domain-containing protein, partial [Pyrinomonadaceae bacterium]
MAPRPTKAVEVFYSYSHEDEQWRDLLDTHLALLKREGVIRCWHDRKITPGTEWHGKIHARLNSADIILLLVSPHFLASDYCYDVEVERAMQRHEDDEATVIPIILRPCEWTRAPFGKLTSLPRKPAAVTLWGNSDEAFVSIAKGLREAAEARLWSDTDTTDGTEDPCALPEELIIPSPPIFGFVPRQDEEGRDIIERLWEVLLERGGQVTLSGVGGIGKTTIAAEAARGLESKFGGRVVWSRAEGRADYTDLSLYEDVATSLGRRDLHALPRDEKKAQVRKLAAAAPTLVVLDNFETIVSEEQQRVKRWLKTARCSALFVSLEKSASSIFDTESIEVPSMIPAEAEEFLRRLLTKIGDTQVFTKEIRARILKEADHRPYPIQWIVAQIRLNGEPMTVLQEMRSGEGDAAERAFNRAFNLPQLGDDGRAALLALSLFKPSASREALAEVAGFDGDLKRLGEAISN